MKRFSLSFFYTALFIIFAQTIAFLAFADSANLSKPPVIVVYLEGFAKNTKVPNYTITPITEGFVDDTSVCIGPPLVGGGGSGGRGPGPRPEPLSEQNKSNAYLIVISNLPYDFDKFKPDLPGFLQKNSFLKSSTRILPSFILKLKGLQPSVLTDLNSSEFKISSPTKGSLDGHTIVCSILHKQ